MNVIPLLIADAKSSLTEQPTEGCFDDVAVPPQTAAVLGVALGDQRINPALSQRFANLVLRVVSAVGKHFIRTFAPATTT